MSEPLPNSLQEPLKEQLQEPLPDPPLNPLPENGEGVKFEIRQVADLLIDIREKRLASEADAVEIANKMRDIRLKRFVRAQDPDAFEHELRARRGMLDGPLPKEVQDTIEEYKSNMDLVNLN